MAVVVKQICAVSILCGVAMTLTPEGSVKKVMALVCSVVLMSNLTAPLVEFDFSGYSLEIAKYRVREYEFLENSSRINETLNRKVIEQQCASYILDKAVELNMGKPEIKVSVQWDTDGVWIPCSVEIKHGYCRALAEYIETELGIPEEQQRWVESNEH